MPATVPSSSVRLRRTAELAVRAAVCPATHRGEQSGWPQGYVGSAPTPDINAPVRIPPHRWSSVSTRCSQQHAKTEDIIHGIRARNGKMAASLARTGYRG